jgi:hypothetical protein
VPRPTYVEGVSEREEFYLHLVSAGDVARMVDPPVSTESVRRWTLEGKLRSIARLPDGTRLFLLEEVKRFNEWRKMVKLPDPVLTIEDAETEPVSEARDGE